MLKFLRGRERGQVLVMVVGLIPVLLGMTGMAVDIGGYAGHKRHLQNAADAIALAAAQDLCKVNCTDTSAAAATANQWAIKNNINPSEVTLTFTGGGTTPTVRATIQDTHKFAFMRVVGISSKGIGATAAAQKVSMGGGAGIVPWSITQQTVDGSPSGTIVTMKYDTTGSNTGNFGAIRIDGPGANVYQDSASYGSQDVACAISAPNCVAGACPGTYPTSCSENSPTCDGPECDPQTGNLIGPTRDAVDFRMNNTSTTCDSFDEVFSPLSAYHRSDAPSELQASIDIMTGAGKLFSPLDVPKTDTPTAVPTNTPPPTNTPTPVPPTNTATPVPPTNTATAAPPTSTPTVGPSNTPGPSPTNTTVPAPTATPGGATKYHLNADCNPWTDGPGKCTNNNVGTLCSRRLIIIPVVDGFGNGGSDPTIIQRFALVYLEGYDAGKCQGNNCDIKGRFVTVDVNPRVLAGNYDPTASVHFTKLID